MLKTGFDWLSAFLEVRGALLLWARDRPARFNTGKLQASAFQEVRQEMVQKVLKKTAAVFFLKFGGH
jgi:hypothetical protein